MGFAFTIAIQITLFSVPLPAVGFRYLVSMVKSIEHCVTSLMSLWVSLAFLFKNQLESEILPSRLIFSGIKFLEVAVQFLIGSLTSIIAWSELPRGDETPTVSGSGYVVKNKSVVLGLLLSMKDIHCLGYQLFCLYML